MDKTIGRTVDGAKEASSVLGINIGLNTTNVLREMFYVSLFYIPLFAIFWRFTMAEGATPPSAPSTALGFLLVMAFQFAYFTKQVNDLKRQLGGLRTREVAPMLQLLSYDDAQNCWALREGVVGSANIVSGSCA